MVDFYPRSPCGERRKILPACAYTSYISIHALLAESDGNIGVAVTGPPTISIHALLAESDNDSWGNYIVIKIFLSTLSLRRATYPELFDDLQVPISIHALLAESDYIMTTTICTASKFLSTLSLRRATISGTDFYRSAIISIHALLAESDREPTALRTPHHRFLSTLSLRRATIRPYAYLAKPGFLSTLSLRRATYRSAIENQYSAISIHALLAESDPTMQRALGVFSISIHALLAESDCDGPFHR